jgi:hypothetical protein
VDINGLRRTARNGLDDGDFHPADLRISFRANRGSADALDIDAFIRSNVTTPEDTAGKAG